VPEGILRGSYEALARGDAGPLLGMLPPSFEWTEPELPGYPLSGVHRGASGLAQGLLAPLAELLDGLTFELGEVVVDGDREVVLGAMRGSPAGSAVEWELPFAHVWELSDGAPVRATGYFDRGRLTLASNRKQLAELADDLLEQAAEIRLQWSRLGDALRAAGVEGTEGAEGTAPSDEEGGPDAPEDLMRGAASARLVAVDMAHEGSTREEVEAYLREQLGVEDTDAILGEVFDPSGDPHADLPVEEASGAARLSRLFARNRG
jgi:ketosteroid isomerase-like protein